MGTLPGVPAHLHIVGIGGAGMSAIARVLLGRGYAISGSDRQLNPTTDALARDGAQIFQAHAASNIGDAAAVLISSAIKPDNPEVAAAQAKSIPVLKRRDALGAITEDSDVIAVAGTHGKTTTTALITHILIETGRDPTYIVGGTLQNTGTNAGVGRSRWFIIEADEYDLMFLGLRPRIAVITNIEHDHPDMFPTLADVEDAFMQFAAKIRSGGTLIGFDDERGTLAKVAGGGAYHVIRYDLDAARNGLVDAVMLPPALAGDHNLLNAYAAALAAQQAGVELPAILTALSTFRGTARRMEEMGERAGITVYSDYGHHPTALRATLQGARARFADRTIWAVWQPHTYSRTHLLATEFAEAFDDADHVLITDVYAAREQPRPGPTPAEIARRATEHGHPDARASAGLEATANVLRTETRPGDIVIIFSAGDAPRIGELLLEEHD